MAVITPWALNALDAAPAYDAVTLRNHWAGLLGTGSAPLMARPGVLGPGLDVTVDDPTVTVSAGVIVVTTLDGSYVTGLDGDWTGTLDARDATNPRVDKVVVQVLDDATHREGQVSILAGTPAAVPAAPATPDGAEVLATIAVPADGGGAPAVTPLQRYTAAKGATIWTPDSTARDRCVVVDGDEAWVDADSGHYVRVGGAWQVDARSVSIDPAAFFTPTAGVSIVSGAVEAVGKSVVWELRLASTALAIAAGGGQNVVVGAVNAPYRPRSYFAPWNGFAGTPWIHGLCAAGNGELTVRESSAAVTNPPTIVIGGSWPI